MTASKHHVTIKGVKDGLVFHLDDKCEFSALLAELRHKLEKTHQRILTGPIVHVHVKLGARIVSQEQKESIRNIIGLQGNLLIQSIEAEKLARNDAAQQSGGVKVIRGLVRSGQTVHHSGDMLFMGDVNAGGTITSTGDIYILGSLRGVAHAGIEGNKTAIIAAAYLKPTQLRIADVISRPPDEWGIGEAVQEFAYLNDGKMEIHKISNLHKIRPGLSVI